MPGQSFYTVIRDRIHEFAFYQAANSISVCSTVGKETYCARSTSAPRPRALDSSFYWHQYNTQPSSFSSRNFPIDGLKAEDPMASFLILQVSFYQKLGEKHGEFGPRKPTRAIFVLYFKCIALVRALKAAFRGGRDS
jgi:hypothetical protein